MRSPSIENLMNKLNLSKDDAKLFKETIKQLQHPKNGLLTAKRLMGGCGIESLYPDYPYISYVNMGETYDVTLMYNEESEVFFISSWGDYVETHKAVANDGSNPRNSKYWRAI